MRVLLAHTEYRERGGEDTVVAADEALLRSAGHEVIRFTRTNPTAASEAVPTLLRSVWNRRAADDLVREIERTQPDVVHIHNTWFALSAAAIPAAAATSPVVVTAHNYRTACLNSYHFRDGSICDDCVGRSTMRGVVRGCYRGSVGQSAVAHVALSTSRRRGAWNRAHVVLALTEFSAERLAIAGVDRPRITVRPNWVGEFNGALSTSPGTEVLAIGRATEEKGFAGLIGAWRRATPEGLTLSVVGDGPALDELTALARGEPSISVLGRIPRDEVLSRMASARALIVPSKWYEGMPMVMLEAMSAGLPVIAEDQPGMAPLRAVGDDLIVQDLTGAGWTAASELLMSSGRLELAGETARSVWRDEHSPEAGLRTLTQAYEDARFRFERGE